MNNKRFAQSQRFLCVFGFITGLLFLVFAIVPGDFSPFGSLQVMLSAFTRDGSFGGLNLVSYRKFQKIVFAPALGLLAGSVAFAYALRYKRLLLARNLTIAFGSGAAIVLLLFGNLALGRSNSMVYRQLFGVIPPTVTPVPITSPTPIPTPVTFGTGRWQLIIEDLSSPTAVVDPGDGSGRLFILEKTGTIQVVYENILAPDPFFDLRDRVLQTPENFEQGLLGLTFHPQFSENGYFYVYYIDYQENSVLSRFTVSEDGQTGDPTSEFRLLGILQPGARHNGGTLAFGPDGYLYVSVGDGDLREKTKGHAQSLDEVFGKILRLDVDHGNPYAIPPDNPFVDAYGRDEIYLSGLRNPWKFSFDSLTGDLYIGDVGQNDWEEINFLAMDAPGGLNYGWDVMEGPEDFSGYRGPPVQVPNFTAPIYYYHHKYLKCAVTGGVVYHGTAFPELDGTYLFGDFCAGYIWGLKRTSAGEWEATLLYDTEAQITSFGTDADGEVYLADMRGMIYTLVP